MKWKKPKLGWYIRNCGLSQVDSVRERNPMLKDTV